MTISYNWLCEYLGVKPEPKKLSDILTSIGLEVESMESFEVVKGSLRGLVIGKVIACEKHPNADKLSLTSVDTGDGTPLQIVCGAPNVAIGQKVIVAPVGVTIYPVQGEPLTMKPAKIRGVESQGMICAEDEIGLGESHAGIIVLPEDAKPGATATSYYNPYTDIIYEIGLTPNRMDAMSHMGVARDVLAYLNYHEKTALEIKSPFPKQFKADSHSFKVKVQIENNEACRRYAGIAITGIEVKASPAWLQNKLKAVGVRSINNIVDITNFILHETGQPLHAFDGAAVSGGTVIIKNLPEGTPFVTLDEKERKLSSEDLMICNENGPMCIAGVFGGLESGVKPGTTSIFLESAWFNPTDIRKTSFRHGLRTDAATRFEKGIDISNTVKVLQRAALMIKEMAGGEISSDLIDVYPSAKEKTVVTLPFDYLKRLSGKLYSKEDIRSIFTSLGFEIEALSEVSVRVSVPYHKLDISIPADLVEEILRIDGYDNVTIPRTITISPSVQKNNYAALKDKVAGLLTGYGFNEVMTNSITNSAYFNDETLARSVKMLNSLSAELDLMRPSLLETGLQSLAYNLNRRQTDLSFFEFGRTYEQQAPGKYLEQDHLVLFMSGNQRRHSWKSKGQPVDFHTLKGITSTILKSIGIAGEESIATDSSFQYGTIWSFGGKEIAKAGQVSAVVLSKFDIKQPVFYTDFNWDILLQLAATVKLQFAELPKQLPVHRDLSLVVPKSLIYGQIQTAISGINLKKLKKIELFDVFESDKLGAEKKSMAVSFDFLDEEKTLTDKEIDGMMSRIITTLEKECAAEIRK